jgi:hypothetical protein
MRTLLESYNYAGLNSQAVVESLDYYSSYVARQDVPLALRKIADGCVGNLR